MKYADTLASINWKKTYKQLEGTHAFLSPSSYHWMNYDEEKLIQTYQRRELAALGSKFHRYAQLAIELGQRQPDTTAALNRFINDAIGFRMQSEQILFYSVNCYGTADAISFSNNELRIHDLKTGLTPGSLNQLLPYAALFALDYRMEPEDYQSILRLYQGDTVTEWIPEPMEIRQLMLKIIRFDSLIDEFGREGII